MHGELLKEKRQQIVISTKYSFPTHVGDPNSSGNHRKSMVRFVEESIERLKTDYVDILYVHTWDDAASGEEILRAMDDLVDSGKVLYLGISNSPAWQITLETLHENY